MNLDNFGLLSNNLIFIPNADFRSVKMDRRYFLVGAGISAVSGVFPAFAQTPSPAPAAVSDITIISALPPLPADLADQASQPPAPYTETQLVGTAPPTTDEIDKALSFW
jgi:hypothetical protein